MRNGFDCPYLYLLDWANFISPRLVGGARGRRRDSRAGDDLSRNIEPADTRRIMFVVELAWGGEVCDGIARRGLEITGCPAAQTA